VTKELLRFARKDQGWISDFVGMTVCVLFLYFLPLPQKVTKRSSLSIFGGPLDFRVLKDMNSSFRLKQHFFFYELFKSWTLACQIAEACFGCRWFRFLYFLPLPQKVTKRSSLSIFDGPFDFRVLKDMNSSFRLKQHFFFYELFKSWTLACQIAEACF